MAGAGRKRAGPAGSDHSGPPKASTPNPVRPRSALPISGTVGFLCAWGEPTPREKDDDFDPLPAEDAGGPLVAP